MNETIGVKGGKNDRKRRLFITQTMKNKLKKYQEELKKEELIALEKKIKQEQRLTFLKILPIVTMGQIYTTLTRNPKQEKDLLLKEVIDRLEKENMFSEKQTNEIIEALKFDKMFSLDDETLSQLGISREKTTPDQEFDITVFTKLSEPEIEYKVEDSSNNKVKVTEDTTNVILQLISLDKQDTIQNKVTNSSETISEKKEQSEQLEELPLIEQKSLSKEQQPPKKVGQAEIIEESSDKIAQLKNHKLVDAYEKKLKEVRTDLRNLIFEYNIIATDADELYDSKAADELLERLTQIIKKIEELKAAIAIPDISKYNDNYLYTLIEEYIESFKNRNLVEEIKDSPLYIMISEKLEELDSKKDKLQSKIEERKDKLEIDEKQLVEVREKYHNYESFNRRLLEFQLQQDLILNDIRDKMDKAVSVQEKVEVQVVGMQKQMRRLKTLLALQMALPGARSAKALATMTATYLYFMKNIINPQTISKKYKVINVKDYHKNIEQSLHQLDDINKLLSKTLSQIDRTIKEFEQQFAEYLNVLPECKNLLSDLEHVKDQIKEKDFELQKIKLEQERNLEKNDAKVKTLKNEVPM